MDIKSRLKNKTTLTANDGRMIRLISNINDTTMETVKIIIPYTPVTLNINN